MKKNIAVAAATLLFLCFSSFVAAQEDAKGIMDKSFNRPDGDDAYFKIEMFLIDKKGESRKRILEIYAKDYSELRKTTIKFNEPGDIRGTGFLIWENENTDDTQYLYLPALKRSKMITSSQKNLKFVNTDFTYEDMQRRRPDKDRHTLLGEEAVNGKNCFIIESIPLDNSQYSKRIIRVDKESLVIVKVEFYNKKGAKVKVFAAKKIEKKQGIWTATETTMDDLNEKHTTIMRITETGYNQNLPDKLFTVRNLEEE